MIRLLLLIIVAGIGFSYNAIFPPVDIEQREVMIQNAVMKVLEEAHYKPQDINNEYSTKVFDYYIDYIDAYKRFFTKEDIASLEEYRLSIDDQVKANELTFFNKSMELLDARIKEVRTYYDEIIQEEFDFESQKMYELDAEKRIFVKNSLELKEHWRNGLQYEIVVKIARKIEHYKDLKEEKSMDEIKKEAIKEVKENYNEWFKRFNKVRRSDRYSVYLNTLTHIFDPHSDYMSPKDKQDFDISMGGKLEGIGARLQTDGDFTKVVSIVPGGPVWRDKRIEVNDVILKVRQDGKDEILDIFGMRVDDVVQHIRGKKGTIVHLTMKKKDGSIVDIDLTRDIVNTQESLARSILLNLGETEKSDKKVDNIGYIHLPKFYSSFEGKDGNSCAEDVKIELQKLIDNSVNGVILDLRNNGGGSLVDVVEMSGLFIENGPIVQVKPRRRNPFVYKDDDTSVLYSGPLVVLINGFSASASEILAAAMQDYDRAIIVGNKSYGKGTVQRFVDLDRAVRGFDDLKPLGNLLVTMQKFYRINGGSTQLKGVEPDIYLPDRYTYMDVGEKEYDYALEWTSIDPLSFSQSVRVEDNKEELARRSRERTEKSITFHLIDEQAHYLKEKSEMSKYPLSLKAYQNVIDLRKAGDARFKDIMKEDIEELYLSNMEADLGFINMDETTEARNEDWINALHKDVYLEEALNIIKDMIDLEQ
ncbi:MAG: carboxy terminal-processing peptidase [Saprospiraceae bacterium]